MKNFNDFLNENTTENRESLLSQVDIKGLEKLLSDYLDSDIKLEANIVEYRHNRKDLKIVSQDLTSETGIMSKLYEKFGITIDGGYLQDAPDEGDDITYSVTVHFYWTYKSHGSNGTDVCRAFYNFRTKEWKLW